ncbi:Malonate--CoA ligase [Platanthera zijinensis]|uniref:Malonate--CoA ligase n=1 Tax=Platanthera zijinensis TaxID=2320716 RepID=A0AAP0B1S1_9ASPA
MQRGRNLVNERMRRRGGGDWYLMKKEGGAVGFDLLKRPSSPNSLAAISCSPLLSAAIIPFPRSLIFYPPRPLSLACRGLSLLSARALLADCSSIRSLSIYYCSLDRAASLSCPHLGRDLLDCWCSVYLNGLLLTFLIRRRHLTVRITSPIRTLVAISWIAGVLETARPPRLFVTKESFIDDGFFKTGDTVAVDEDGYHVILGQNPFDLMVADWWGESSVSFLLEPSVSPFSRCDAGRIIWRDSKFLLRCNNSLAGFDDLPYDFPVGVLAQEAPHLLFILVWMKLNSHLILGSSPLVWIGDELICVPEKTLWIKCVIKRVDMGSGGVQDAAVIVLDMISRKTPKNGEEATSVPYCAAVVLPPAIASSEL